MNARRRLVRLRLLVRARQLRLAQARQAVQQCRERLAQCEQRLAAERLQLQRLERERAEHRQAQARLLASMPAWALAQRALRIGWLDSGIAEQQRRLQHALQARNEAVPPLEQACAARRRAQQRLDALLEQLHRLMTTQKRRERLRRDRELDEAAAPRPVVSAW